MEVIMTQHCLIDRLDRLTECVTVLGMGKIVIEAKDNRYPGTIRKMTATGIMLVFDENTDALVTGYMATAAQMYSIYRQAGVQRIPQKVYTRIHKNNERFSYLHNI